MAEPNKQLIAEWVAALRSGEFRQGKGRLRKGDLYCCLGVAVELARRKGLISGDWVLSPTGSHYSIRGETEVFPPEVVMIFGLTRINLTVLWHGGYEQITWLNDMQELPFTQIADAIESTYLQESK